jgi:hypothetical protein
MSDVVSTNIGFRSLGEVMRPLPDGRYRTPDCMHEEADAERCRAPSFERVIAERSRGVFRFAIGLSRLNQSYVKSVSFDIISRLHNRKPEKTTRSPFNSY